MKALLIFMFLFPTIIAFGQDTTYYDYDWNKTASIKSAHYYEIVEHDQADTNRATEKTYFKSGQIRTEKNYLVYKDKKLEGKLKEWYESGQLRKDVDYKNGKLNGQLLTYWDNGTPKRTDSYKNDELIDGKCFNSDGKETIHYGYEKMAEFPGGMDKLTRYLIKKMKYPKKSKKNKIEGRVVVRFIVNKDGTLSSIKIIESINNELDENAIHAVKKMPKWEPGMQDGETVRMAFHLPISYRLK